MNDFSSQHQKKNGSGNHPNSIAAGTRNLIPYRPGQSGNPGGRPRGIPRISNCYERLLKMSPAELQQFVPQNAAEAVALRQVSAAIYGSDALPAAKEITDRTEGKAIQRRVDLTTDDVISKAKLLYSIGQRFVAQMQAALTCSGCGHHLDFGVSNEQLLSDILFTIDEQYHEAVIRELEAME